ncbi:MAG: hypothetical protein ACOCXG_05825 [Nanoarchaeota archaeon]
MENNDDVLWLKRNKFSLHKFAVKQVPKIEVQTFKNELWSEPSLTRSLLQNHRKSNPQKVELFFNETIRKKSFLGVAIAGKRKGKTSSVYRLAFQFWLEGYFPKFRAEILELSYQDDYKTIFNKFGESKHEVFIFAVLNVPPFIQTTYNLSSIPEGAMLIIDEGAIFQNSRNSANNSSVGVVMILPILAHQDLKILVISQDDMLIDKNFFRTLDFKLVKQLSADYKNERDLFSELDMRFIEQVEDKSQFYFKSEDIIMTCSLDMCPGYEKYSKSFAKLKLPGQEKEGIQMSEAFILNTEYSAKEIKNIMNIFGFVKPVSYFEELKKKI